MLFHHYSLGQSFVVILLCSIWVLTTSAASSIYEALTSNGLPMGLLPKGVNNFTLDNSGNFVFHLDQPCNAKFEIELHYERTVSGTLSYGKIDALSGISAKDLFLWFEVKGIHVDIPSSGVIYFDVGVVSKQFSFSSFDKPKECTAVQVADLQDSKHILEAIDKSLSGELRYKLDQGNIGNAVL